MKYSTLFPWRMLSVEQSVMLVPGSVPFKENKGGLYERQGDSRDEMFQNSTVNVLNAIATLSRGDIRNKEKRAKPGRKKPEKGS